MQNDIETLIRMWFIFFLVPECHNFTVPPNGAISDPALSFIGGDIQTITCNTGFRANGATTITCMNLNATSAEWQPAPGLTTCGKGIIFLNC